MISHFRARPKRPDVQLYVPRARRSHGEKSPEPRTEEPTLTRQQEEHQSTIPHMETGGPQHAESQVPVTDHHLGDGADASHDDNKERRKHRRKKSSSCERSRREDISHESSSAPARQKKIKPSNDSENEDKEMADVTSSLSESKTGAPDINNEPSCRLSEGTCEVRQNRPETIGSEIPDPTGVGEENTVCDTNIASNWEPCDTNITSNQEPCDTNITSSQEPCESECMNPQHSDIDKSSTIISTSNDEHIKDSDTKSELLELTAEVKDSDMASNITSAMDVESNATTADLPRAEVVNCESDIETAVHANQSESSALCETESPLVISGCHDNNVPEEPKDKSHEVTSQEVNQNSGDSGSTSQSMGPSESASMVVDTNPAISDAPSDWVHEQSLSDKPATVQSENIINQSDGLTEEISQSDCAYSKVTSPSDSCEAVKETEISNNVVTECVADQSAHQEMDSESSEITESRETNIAEDGRIGNDENLVVNEPSTLSKDDAPPIESQAKASPVEGNTSADMDAKPDPSLTLVSEESVAMAMDTGHQSSSTEDGEEVDEESWDTLFDENGDSLDSQLMEEVCLSLNFTF